MNNFHFYMNYVTGNIFILYTVFPLLCLKVSLDLQLMTAQIAQVQCKGSWADAGEISGERTRLRVYMNYSLVDNAKHLA